MHGKETRTERKKIRLDYVEPEDYVESEDNLELKTVKNCVINDTTLILEYSRIPDLSIPIQEAYRTRRTVVN